MENSSETTPHSAESSSSPQEPDQANNTNVLFQQLVGKIGAIENQPSSTSSSSQKSGVFMTNETLQKLLEKIESLEKGQESRKRNREEERDESGEKRAREEDGGLQENDQTKPPPQAIPMKRFTMRHTFDNFSNRIRKDSIKTDGREWFGTEWSHGIRLASDDVLYIGLYLGCSIDDKKEVEAEYETRLLSGDQVIARTSRNALFEHKNVRDCIATGCGWMHPYNWGQIQEQLVDGKLVIESEIVIKKMEGFYNKPILMDFGAPMEQWKDVTFIVEDREFNVSRRFLASMSPYFDGMLCGKYDESTKPVIPLYGVDLEDFQNYMECLYGKNPITDATVEGIIHIAHMYETPIVLEKCENFLTKFSEKSVKTKLELSQRYRLDEFMKKCISEFNSLDEIQTVMKSVHGYMEPYILRELQEKHDDLCRNPRDEGILDAYFRDRAAAPWRN